ncbi:MAG TPA: nitronate monooxygenase [Gordonia sp. (in: high G+C Gram-positive bacteria)]|uniref:NAD(P)H-dependent flavin oxidoreductase n=1 Tax=unclassified Gordonia (in: high G+C Gram-positive bacteria) TaxID=2657482 RepID=UPI0025B807AF|nr:MULTISPECIES: nitronate monooxygenase [unclassified Gordonia (in: high G+C Gram-positive bacteria)]HNP57258.1 nitronate monooxygenase [Gordonia sp. (in: high G+C Gram-positive bacteria)]HRC49322.1 nitronate monooxygenase [Gordonia sp. (in: high G+C Gram-positive bacteria)]
MTSTSALLERLRLPVVAAPMFLVSGPDLVAAACEAGVVGSFPTPNCRTTAQLDEWMGTIRDRVDAGAASAPWAVNLVTHSTNTRLAEDLRIIEAHRPDIVITALGSPKPVMEVVKGYGGTVVADVVNLKLAYKAVEAGVDGLACICTGAGGHTGYLSPFAFISAVRQFFDGIVTVGGAISDGASIAGAVAAGADLVYMGTRFLASQESMAQPEYKQMVVDYGIDDVVVSDGITGTNASWLRPSLVDNGYDPDNMAFTGSRQYDAAGDGPSRWKDVWAAGQGLQTIGAVSSVAEIVDELAGEYAVAVDRLTTRRERAQDSA